MAGEEIYHQGQDRGVVEKRENLMSKDRSAYRLVGYIHVRDGKARSDGEGEVGEVELVRTLVAWKGKPSGRFFGSIVLGKRSGVQTSCGVFPTPRSLLKQP